MAAGHEWRALAGRPGFPHVPFFPHAQLNGPHFPPQMLPLDHQNRVGLGIVNRKFIHHDFHSYIPKDIEHFYDPVGSASPLAHLNNPNAIGNSIATNNNSTSNNNNNNPHSTTSPNLSPANISLTNSSQLTPPHTDENDNNLNDDSYENDNISVTGSPARANSTEDDERRSPSPMQTSTSILSSNATELPSTGGGAFTSLIQRNSNPKKNDFLSNFTTNLHQRPATISHPLHQPSPQQSHALNHALAAQLFLQSPLMPQPSQWLYSQLYGNNYNELPWFRSSLQTVNGNGLRFITNNNATANDSILTPANSLANDTNTNEQQFDSATTIKRNVTLISHLDDEKETSASPPVTSTKRTPSPQDDIEIVSQTKAKSDSLKCRTAKHVDVWRPY